MENEGNVHLDMSLCAMVIDADFQITLPTGPQALQGAWSIDLGDLGHVAGHTGKHYCQSTALNSRTQCCCDAEKPAHLTSKKQNTVDVILRPHV